jgi:regulator of cell morphogenesis and NO signaling
MTKTQDQTAPAAQDSSEAPVGQLVQRLLREHRRWRTRDFPLIAHLFEEAQSAEGAAQPPCLAPLQNAFYRLCAELEGHMNREETILFPAIIDAQAKDPQAQAKSPGPSFGSIGNPIAMVEQEHDWEAERLEKIRELAQNYELPENAPEKLRLLFHELEALEAAMHAHTRLESSILFASALSRERKARQIKAPA